MFASVALSARIDRAEGRLTTTVAGAVLQGDRGTDAFIENLAGGVAVFTTPSSPMNKMIGVGFEGLPESERLDGIEALYQSRKAPLQAEVCTLADPAFAAMLTRRGYVLEGFENVLGRPLGNADAEPPLDGTMTIKRMEQAESERWLEVAVTGFLDPDGTGVLGPALPQHEELRRVAREFGDAPGLLRYCAWMDGELAGVASLRIDSGIAQLCGAATLPAFRRRGIQTELVRRRLWHARRNGCDVAVMTTQPGSKSHENGHRQGFVLLYGRAILVKHAD